MATKWSKDEGFTYDFQGKFLRKLNIAKIQPYVTLSNFVTFTRYTGYDPEMSQIGRAHV